MNDKIYVSTSIPYVNAKPHIGFALELVQADVIARFHRLSGHQTYFQTGTDENAFKNVLSARKEGLAAEKLVDRNSTFFQSLAKSLHVFPDRFVRTSQRYHKSAVHRLWRRLKPEDIYLKNYKGLYCEGCEDFYLERDLVNGRCPDHDTEPVEIQETNYFFRLSDYQDTIETLLNTNAIHIVPERRKNEILGFIRKGLQDYSISRLARRSGGWGIEVPSDDSQTIYVWIDALINYISGLGYGNDPGWNVFWDAHSRKIHVIGKNVWKFHAIYWPALLLSAGLPLPDEILIHGFVTENGQKISKSLGNAVDPNDLIVAYGADAVRYYLLSAISPFEDGDFSLARFRQVYNADLANGLGNLVHRIASLCGRADYGPYHKKEELRAPEDYLETITAFEFNKAIKILWTFIVETNRDIDRKQPWRELKRGNSGILKKQLTEWLEKVQTVGHWLSPFLPETSRKIDAFLSADRITAGSPLFPRIQ